MAIVHPTAIVDPGAELAHDVEIGAYTLVGPKVRVDHDISMLVPELFSRMSPEERDAHKLIAEGCDSTPSSLPMVA